MSYDFSGEDPDPKDVERFRHEDDAVELLQKQLGEKPNFIQNLGHLATLALEKIAKVRKRTLFIGTLGVASTLGVYAYIQQSPTPPAPTHEAPFKKVVNHECLVEELRGYAPEDITGSRRIQAAESCLEVEFINPDSTITTPQN
jgi:hypothetical protein